MTAPRILALDFDGVVCDGRPEYFETAWQAYVAAWPPPALTAARPDTIAARFSELRPLIESGWEMPLMVHALLAGVGNEALGRALNKVRDDWFSRDAPSWLAHHRFYDGVPGRILTLLGSPTE